MSLPRPGPPVPPYIPDCPEHLRDLIECHCVDTQTRERPTVLPWDKLGPPASYCKIGNVENVWLVLMMNRSCPCGWKPTIGWTMFRQLADFCLHYMGWPTFGYLILDTDIPGYLRREEICAQLWLGPSLSTLWLTNMYEDYINLCRHPANDFTKYPSLVQRRDWRKMWDVQYPGDDGTFKLGRSSSDMVVTVCKGLGWKAIWHDFSSAQTLGQLQARQDSLKNIDGGWVIGFVWAKDQETGLATYSRDDVRALPTHQRIKHMATWNRYPNHNPRTTWNKNLWGPGTLGLLTALSKIHPEAPVTWVDDPTIATTY